MCLGRTRSTAASISACTAAQQDHDITWLRPLADDIGSRGSRNDRTNFHSLGNIIRMIQFLDKTCGKTNLVAIGAVSICCCCHDLSLRQTARHRILNRRRRIGCTRDAHRLIHIGTAGQRITDRTAKTCRRTAERLNLRRMVMRLILEHQQPVLLLTIHIHLHLHRARIDLFTLVQIIQPADLPEILGTNRTKIHQGNRLSLPAGIDRLTQRFILLCRIFDIRRFNLNLVQARIKGRMTAVIRPVGINHHDLGESWITLFFLFEVLLQKDDICQIHGKTMVLDKICKACFIQAAEAIQHRWQRRFLIGILDRCRFQKGSLSGFDRIDQGRLNQFLFLVRELALDVIDSGCAHQRSFLASGQLNALGTGICSLVKLTGQIFHCQHIVILVRGRCFLIVVMIYLGLRQNGAGCQLKILWINILDVIAVDNAHRFNRSAQSCLKICADTLCLSCICSFLL